MSHRIHGVPYEYEEAAQRGQSDVFLYLPVQVGHFQQLTTLMARLPSLVFL